MSPENSVILSQEGKDFCTKKSFLSGKRVLCENNGIEGAPENGHYNSNEKLVKLCWDKGHL